MDEVLKRDENRVTVGAGVSPDADLDISMLRVDPITGYLLANIVSSSTGLETSSQIASRDENHRTVCMGWNEDDDELQEILTDEDGNLLCDLLAI